nr:MAG TPA: hypothetical protein [Caudoviricetes sp.]
MKAKNGNIIYNLLIICNINHIIILINTFMQVAFSTHLKGVFCQKQPFH